MRIEELMDLCESLPGVTYDYPFGEQPRCYRVGGRIFADVYPVGVPGALAIVFEDESIPRQQVEPMVLLSCVPEDADFWRGQYPGAVRRPYHSPRALWPHSNTVLLNRGVPDEALRDMVYSAYQKVVKKLPKKTQKEISEKYGEIKGN